MDTAKNWKLKTEKYYNKIIFKCINSTVESIFNKKVVEKWDLWDLWTVHESTVHDRKVKKLRLKEKKKKENFWNVNVRLGSAKCTSQAP